MNHADRHGVGKSDPLDARYIAAAVLPPPTEQQCCLCRPSNCLTQRRLADPAAIIAGLPADSRPAPTVDHYDQLLRLPERRNPAQSAARAE